MPLPAAQISENVGGPGGNADPNQSYIHADLAHVGEYDAALLGQLLRRPGEALPAMGAAAADALRTLLYAADRGPNANAGRDAMDDDADGAANAGDGADMTPRQLFRGASVRVLLRRSLMPTPLGSIQAHHMNSLLKCPGIIISCARVRPRAMWLRIRCAKCMDSRTVFYLPGIQ